ncbi:hypothetical protein Tco_1390203 [Tanacetum coccineum]
MTEEIPFTIPVDTFRDGPDRSDPKEPPVDPNISNPTPENHTRDHTPENASENAYGDPVMQFVVQNFKQINAMYLAFSSKRKKVNPTSLIENCDHPILEPWHSDSRGQPKEAIQQTPRDATLADKPAKKNWVTTKNLDRPLKHKHRNNTAFYNEPFLFVETEINIRDLVASPFIARRDYDMPDGLKVPTNLKTYDGTSYPDDHLTIFMGTIDVYKLPEPAWCRFSHITLCGAARFWYDNLPSGRIRQRSDESLRDYLSRFGNETLHMTDRSDGMMTGAFIRGLRPGRLFKDLIARPPKSMED